MTTVFSFGSNSIAQLRARVENPELHAVPARAPGWERIFCVRSGTWGGAAASLIPKQNSTVYGASVVLNSTELAHLDKFEGGYHKEDIQIEIYQNGRWCSVSAIAYIANTLFWTIPPSEAYLTAIHLNLREQFHEILPECIQEITINGVFSKEGNANVTCCRHNSAINHTHGYCDVVSDAESEHIVTTLVNTRNSDILIETVSIWQYPGTHSLSLPALCVEVNALRKAKWVMPRAVAGIISELKALQIHSSAQLAAKLAIKWSIHQIPEGCLLEYLDQEALDIFTHLLGL